MLGATTAFSTPALQAIIPALVPRGDLGAAVAMNAVTFNLARAIGPVIGAGVVARLGIAWAIAFNALSYLVFAALLRVLTVREMHTRPTSRTRLRDSIKMLARDPSLGVLLFVVAAVSLTMDPVSTLTPSFATTLFHRPDTFAGLLIGAFGAGAVVGSVIPLHDSDSPGQRIALMLGVFSFAMIGFGLIPSLELALALLAVAGFGYLIGQTSATTELQLRVSDSERGRIMALWSVAFLGTRPIAALIDGGLATVIGLRAAVVVMAVPTVAAASFAWRAVPDRTSISGNTQG
jgi:MFS family permease